MSPYRIVYITRTLFTEPTLVLSLVLSLILNVSNLYVERIYGTPQIVLTLS